MIASDEFHLFLADPASVSDADGLHRCRALLSDHERARCDRFRFARDRHHFLVAHALVRTVVARYAGADPSALRFEVGERGRLEVVPGSTPRPVRFNLSHTNGLVAVGVTAKHDVGVDVERLRDVNLDVAEKHFAPSEVLSLRALPAEHQRPRFFAYWTLKEAYIKARGHGLFMSLDRFAVSLTPGEPALLRRCAEGPHELARWSMIDLPPAQGFAGCLIVEGSGPRVRCWDWPG